MKAIDISNILYSTHFTSRIIQHFLSGTAVSENYNLNFNIIYLALPVIFEKNLRQKLANCNARSTLSSLSRGEDYLKVKNSISKIQKNKEEFSVITNQSIIFLSSKDKVIIDEYLKPTEVLNFNKEDKNLKEYFKAAYYWGLIISKEDILGLYLKLGVTRI